MKVAIYNLEPKYTNLALEKIRMYYGEVADYIALEHHLYDKIYTSSLFTFSPKTFVTDDMICGGTGFDLTTKLPEEIERMKPKINMGFTTRGCIRNCGFCVVPEKEGKVRVVGDIYDIWDGKSKEITLLDNNILAVPKHFKKICEQLQKEGLTVDFTQGLDARLITSYRARLLGQLKHKKQVYFAWDCMEDGRKIMEAMPSILTAIPSYKVSFYILIGYDTTPEEDYLRVHALRTWGVDSFVMPYDKEDKYQKRFARWVNHKAIFNSVEWEDYK